MCRRSLLDFLEAGFAAMARYPYDLSELHWTPEPDQPPDDDTGSDGYWHWDRPGRPSSGRSIKLVPPPASQRYQAARPTRLPTRHSQPKQPV